jgi:hypothetical protein
MNRTFASFRLSLLAAALLLVGCKDGLGPVNPSSAALSVSAAQTTSKQSIRVLRRSDRLTTDLSQTATIGPDGGVLEIPEAGVVVTFPAGAVSEPTEITVTAVSGYRVVYEFAPHGLKFNAPVQITQSLAPTRVRGATEDQLDDLLGGYIVRGRADADAKSGNAMTSEQYGITVNGLNGDGVSDENTTVSFNISHFSGYIVGWGIARVSTILW